MKRSLVPALTLALLAVWAASAPGQQAAAMLPATDSGSAAVLPQQGAQGEPAPATLTGTVRDTNNGAVPDALVTARRLDVPAQRPAGSPTQSPAQFTSSTDSDGHFLLAGLPPGKYDVTLEARGLQTYTYANVTLRAGEQQDLSSAHLAISAAGVSVQVTATQDQIAIEQVHEELHQRALGILPTFYSSYIWNAAPLPAKEKFSLAAHSAFDPVTFVGVGLVAGVEQVRNIYPAYNGGPAGFGKRLGATLADESVGRFFSSAVFPSVFHQDPRYFWMGPNGGSKPHRAFYAFSRTLITRGDNGKAEPNYSLILGRVVAGAIANTYHPPSDRGLKLTFGDAALNLLGNAGENFVREFFTKEFTPSLPAYDVGEPPKSAPPAPPATP